MKIKSGNIYADYTNINQILSDIDNLNLNTVNLPVKINIEDSTSTVINIDSNSKTSALSIIPILQAKNINIILEPYPWVANGTIGETEYNPDKTQFFIKWKLILEELINDIANVYNVYAIYTASNLVNLEQYSDDWINLFDYIRQIYKGKLMYRTNWWVTATWDTGAGSTTEAYQNKLNNPLFGEVDIISIASYFEITETPVPSISELKNCIINGTTKYNRKQKIYNEIKAFYDKWNKPIFFGELGYPSKELCASEPWNFEPSIVDSQVAQANCFQAIIDVFSNETWLAGFSIFCIGYTDTNYYIVNKQAGRIITNLWNETRNKNFNHPIIYDKFDTSWQNPIAIPHNSYNEKIHETLNGEYNLTFNNPLDKKSYYIKTENYIEVDGEVFIIRNVAIGKDQNGIVSYEVKAEHVFYEMLDDYISVTTELLEATPQDICLILEQYTDFSFTVEGTYEKKYLIVERGNPIKLINKMFELWDIEMYRNRRNVTFKPSVNAEKIQLFRYGKNLKSLKRTGSSEATTTRLYLIGKDGLTVEGLNVSTIPYHLVLDGNKGYFYNNSTDMVLQFIADTQLVGGTRVLQNMYIDSKYINNYPRPKCNEHKIDSEDQLEILLQGLKELQKIEQEIENYEMSAAEIAKVKGDLEKYGLGWTVLLQDQDILADKQNCMIQARITEYDYYPYQFEDSTVKIGYFNDNVLDFLKKLRETKVKVDNSYDSWDKIKDMIDSSGTISAQWLNDRIKNAGDMIKFGQGNVIGSDKGLMVLDTDDLNTAKAIIIMTASHNVETGKTTPIIGLAERENTTLDFEYRTALDSRGINADEIVTGVLKTSLVKIFGDTNFYWDTNGIFCIDPSNTNKFMKISKEGIRFTSDGGSSWDINISWTVNGFQATRQDKKVRTSLNTVDGFKIEKGDGAGNWESQIWADTEGKMHAKELYTDMIKIQNGTETLLDAGRRLLDLSKFDSILGHITADNIDATSLHVNSANIDGLIAADQIKTNELIVGQNVSDNGYVTQIAENTIKTGSFYAQNLEVEAANIRGTIEADTVKTSWIYTGDIQADQITTSAFTLLDYISIGSSSSYGQKYITFENTNSFGITVLGIDANGDLRLGTEDNVTVYGRNVVLQSAVGGVYLDSISEDNKIVKKGELANVIAVFG